MRATIAAMRIISGVLRAPATGIVARIAAMPRVGGDLAPRAPATILSQADDNVELRERPASGWPVVLVLEDPAGSDYDAEASMGYRDGRVRLMVVVVDEAAVQAEGYRTARYLLQAVVDVIERQLLAVTTLDTAGLSSGIQILQATRMSAGPLNQEFGVGTATAAVRLELQTRDNTP